MSTVAVDFDGVIHAYSRGWADGTIYDGPLPGAIAGLRTLMRTYSVYIHTSRTPRPVADWLIDHGIAAVVEPESRIYEFWTHRGHVLVTNRKLPAIAYIDDRAVRHVTWDLTLATVAGLPESADSSRGEQLRWQRKMRTLGGLP